MQCGTCKIRRSMSRLIDPLRRHVARAFAVAAVLGALLVIAQQGAFVHELGHLAEDLAAVGDAGKHDAPGKVCDQCIAFAPLAGAVAAPVPALPFSTADAVRASHAVAAFIVVAALPPRSRGPPSAL